MCAHTATHTWTCAHRHASAGRHTHTQSSMQIHSCVQACTPTHVHTTDMQVHTDAREHMWTRMRRHAHSTCTRLASRGCLTSPRRHPAVLPGLLAPCRQPLPAGECSGHSHSWEASRALTSTAPVSTAPQPSVPLQDVVRAWDQGAVGGQLDECHVDITTCPWGWRLDALGASPLGGLLNAPKYLRFLSVLGLPVATLRGKASRAAGVEGPRDASPWEG